MTFPRTTQSARSLVCTFGIIMAGLSAAHAQWLTQTNLLRPGWNAVYLHVDPSHATLGDLINPADPIEEVWLWNPALPPGQGVATPREPIGSQWSTWTRVSGPASGLQVLPGRAAALVRVSDAVSSFSWRIKGRPIIPVARWSLSGLNLVGFPVAEPAPSFESYFAPDAQPIYWVQEGEIFRYQGGELGDTNPVRLAPFLFRTTPVRRDQAYWVRTGEIYNQYFGPFEVIDGGTAGIRFADNTSQSRVRLRNRTRQAVTVSLRQVDSEPAPAGQPPVAGNVPLLVRGALNLTNLAYGYSDLSSNPVTWTLAPKGEPGSEAEVILGLDRSRMAGSAGDNFASVLRFTDASGLSRIDLGVSATATARSGLWVGQATVEYVGQYLKSYASATNEADFNSLLDRLQLAQGANGYRYEWDSNSGRVLVFGGPTNAPQTGSYLLDGPIQLDQGGVARPFPLRLIVHHDGTTARLMQRAYVGLGAASNLVVATRQEALLSSQLASARRISAVHLPTTDSIGPWDFIGNMAEGASIITTVQTGHDDHASGPFLHTYHPDHDNLNALFSSSPLPAGRESYRISRSIVLTFTGPPDDFDSLARGADVLVGNYAETVQLQDDQQGTLKEFNVLGTFSLSRILNVATLTTQ